MEEALKAKARDEVPIGAVIVHDGKIIARGSNQTRELNDPIAHAEILAIRDACKIMGAQRIPECDLYVTLEPCTMCAGAISFARIRNLVIGAIDPTGGGGLHGSRFYDQPTCHHKPVVHHGVLDVQSGNLLREFFQEKRRSYGVDN